MLKLLARLIFVTAGAVDFAAVMAGRLASERGFDAFRVMRVEAAGASAGVLLGFLLVSLGRRQRRPVYRNFADGGAVVLALMWLMLMGVGALGKIPKELWYFAGVVWAGVAVATIVVYLAAMFGGADDPSRTGSKARPPGPGSGPSRPVGPPRQSREQAAPRRDRSDASNSAKRRFEWPNQE